MVIDIDITKMNPEEQTALNHYLIPHHEVKSLLFEPEGESTFPDFRNGKTGFEVTRLERKVVLNNDRVEGSEKMYRKVLARLNDIFSQKSIQYADLSASYIVDYEFGRPMSASRFGKLKKNLNDFIDNLATSEAANTRFVEAVVLQDNPFIASFHRLKNDRQEKPFISLAEVASSYDLDFTSIGDVEIYDLPDLKETFYPHWIEDLKTKDLLQRIPYAVTKKSNIKLKNDMAGYQHNYEKFELILVPYHFRFDFGKYVQEALMRLLDIDASCWTDIVVVDSISNSYFSILDTDKFSFNNDYRPCEVKWWS